MFDFGTAVTGEVVGFITDMLAFVDLTTFLGGAIGVAVLGRIGLRLISRLVGIAR